MRLNDDLSRPVTVQAGTHDWVPSPVAGVERRMLYREGGEVARATSIVRYARGSAFPAHVHSGGEEFLVLGGIFQDEHGDYPVGTYVRNPPGTSHRPAAADGCTIFVRLWQFGEGDRTPIVQQPGEGEAAPLHDGVMASRLLFSDSAERVVIEDWRPGAAVTVPNRRGLELLVVSGRLVHGGETLAPQCWCRLPAGQDFTASIGPEGARLWIKDAPLQHPDILPMPERR
ncbi:cupin [Azospirillum brasilense]|uniref:cupin domain-containing protein n=1 Tax=Azospirillum argentinense TaxID=2970906 RepID=UPI00190AFF98|nr:cupin domain-containing protein [Azospirillum argentinense]MBK3798776.1 cupin [Azospirillum argentinense]